MHHSKKKEKKYCVVDVDVGVGVGTWQQSSPLYRFVSFSKPKSKSNPKCGKKESKEMGENRRAKKSEKPQKPLTRHIRQHMIVYKIFPLDDLVLVCVCSFKNPGEENKEKKWNVLIEITAPN